MKKQIIEKIEIPQGITCDFKEKVLTCKKDSLELSRKIDLPQVDIKIKGNQITLECKRGNRNEIKLIKTNIGHISNIFKGLEEKYIYKLESCNVHFPMTVKVEGDVLKVNNFLGEKTIRLSKILPGVEVNVSGSKITVSSHNKEAAGQTAGNMEKATFVKGRDRRIFQDGIYITEKPRGNK
jgi:large subunit ribosomal protein L6